MFYITNFYYILVNSIIRILFFYNVIFQILPVLICLRINYSCGEISEILK